MTAEHHGIELLPVITLLTAVGVATGFPVASSFVSGAGFVLTSTAIVMQLLEERRELNSEGGQRIVSILLFEDLMIVPLLALVAFLAPIAPGSADAGIDWSSIGLGIASIAGLLIAGRYLLNPLFGVLANARARCDDRGGFTRGAGLSLRHGDRRAIDGNGRLPGRRLVVGIQL